MADTKAYLNSPHGVENNEVFIDAGPLDSKGGHFQFSVPTCVAVPLFSARSEVEVTGKFVAIKKFLLRNLLLSIFVQ